jgi:hypothetical protein
LREKRPDAEAKRLRSTETSLPDNELDTKWRSGMTRTYIDESADSLRRRADALLDEMMLGGVDIGAGDGAVAVSQDNSADVRYVNGFTDHSAHQSGTEGRSTLEDSAHEALWSGSIYSERHATAGAGRMTGATSSADFPPVSVPAHAVNALSSLTDMDDGVGSVSAEPVRNIASNRTGRLIPAEQRYARPSVAERATLDAAPSDAPTRSPSSAVRRQSAALASSMTVGVRANARSILLPRAVETDVETAQQEIHALLSEIAVTLPVGHEAAERGRHLLNKAQHILESDPSRTAEVDYYLQQVRRIVQRTRQMHSDSSLYRRRLTIYLTAWAALAITSLAARYALQPELLAFLEALFWTGSDSIFVQFTPMAVGAFFAGAMGATVGVLTNMQRHAAQEHGYFDRKYGLRGLLLPLLGAIFGLVLAAIWATVCYFIGWDATSLWIGSLPAVVALVFGFAQERLYGAR